MRLTLALERIVNRLPSYGQRHRYVTFDPAAEPLERLLKAFDSIIAELNWNDVTYGLLYPTRCRMLRNGRPPVKDLPPELLDSLEESAAEVASACQKIESQRHARGSPSGIRLHETVNESSPADG